MDLFSVTQCVVLATERVERARAEIEAIAGAPQPVVQLVAELQTIGTVLSEIHAYVQDVHRANTAPSGVLAREIQRACSRAGDVALMFASFVRSCAEPSADSSGSSQWKAGLEDISGAKLLSWKTDLDSSARSLRGVVDLINRSVAVQREAGSNIGIGDANPEHRAELPAPRGDPAGSDKTDNLYAEEDDPFADRHRLSFEEQSQLSGREESNYESLSQPAELPALINQRDHYIASWRQKPDAAHSERADAAPSSSKGHSSHAAQASTQAPQQKQRQEPPSPPIPHEDTRPMAERLPSEFYPPVDFLRQRGRANLPRATDAKGRWVSKKAVSRAALQLAGIGFTERDVFVQLHIDPGPIAMQDLRTASASMQDEVDWWRQEGPDTAAYPHPRGAVDAPVPESRLKRRLKLFTREGRSAAGPSRARVAVHDDHADSDEDQPVKRVYT